MKKNPMKVLVISALAGTILSLASCSITRKPDGTIEVRESTNPTQNGTYNRVDIGGKCYLSNGTWCIPCNGGKVLSCEEIRRVIGDRPWTQPSTIPGATKPDTGTPPAQPRGGVTPSSAEYFAAYGYNIRAENILAPSETMLWSAKALSNGLTGDNLSFALGLNDWQPDVSHGTVFSLNSYDSVTQTVDITYITTYGANAPLPGTDTNRVTVEYFHFGGDPNDMTRDAIGIRIAGPIEAVATVVPTRSRPSTVRSRPSTATSRCSSTTARAACCGTASRSGPAKKEFGA